MNSAFELTGEQQHQAHSPRDGVLTVSNCTHKSMVAAIFRFASTLQGRRPASTRIRKPPTTVSSAVRTALPALHHSTPFAPRGCHPPPVSLSSLERRNAPTFGLVSNLGTGFAYIRLFHLVLNEVVSADHCRQLPVSKWMPAVIYPHSLSVCGEHQYSAVAADPRGVPLE